MSGTGDSETVSENAVEAHHTEAEPSTLESLRSRRTVDVVIVAVLTVLAIMVRVGQLAPSSLWVDDAWVGYVVKAPFASIPTMGLTSPGFMALQKVWLGVVGFSELKAQLLPFIASVVTPGAMYLMLRRVVRRELAAVGGLVLALTTLNVEYATRVKQYTIETLATVVVFALAIRWLQSPGPRRLWAFVVATCVACALSFLVIVAAAGSLLAIGVRSLRDGRRRIIEGAAPGLALAIFVVGWYAGVIRPNIGAGTENYWSDHYVVTDLGLRDVAASLRDRTWEMFDAFTPYPAWIVAVVCSITFVAALLKRFELALMALVPLLAAAVLAGLHLAPLGGGRTDSHLLVPLLLGVIVGLDALVELIADRCEGAGIRCDVTVLGAATAALFAGITVASYESPLPYPVEDIRPLVAELDARREDGDVVLLYYASMFGYGLYSDTPSSPAPEDRPDAWNQYAVEFSDPLLVLQINHRDDPTQYLQYAEAALARGDRIWLLGSHLNEADWPEIRRQLSEDLGLELSFTDTRENASLELWVVPGG